MMPDFSAQGAFSRAVFMSFRKAYGTNPMVLDFLLIFEELRKAYIAALQDNIMDEDDPESVIVQDSADEVSLGNRFRRSSSLMLREIKRNDLYKIIEDGVRLISPLLRRVAHPAAPLSHSGWQRLVLTYVEILRASLADKSVIVAIGYVPTPRMRWLQLRAASAKQEVVERLKYDDPELYTRSLRSKEQSQKLNRAIEAQIGRDGLAADRVNVLGRIVNVGIDLATGEKTVYDVDGSRVPLDEFFDKIRGSNKELQEAARVNPKSLRDLESLRKTSPDQMVLLNSATSDQIQYVSMTDDPNKDTSLTRIYPVVEVDGVQYVQSGRFKGFAMPDLVNRAGRQLEGSLYYYDPESKRITRREVKNEKGLTDVRRQSEPYVTLTKVKGKTKLLLTIESSHEWSEVRKSIFKLSAHKNSELPSSIEYQEGTRRSVYLFEPKDFGVIRKRLGGLAMSNAAARYLKQYFDDLLRAQQAADSEDLARFDLLGLKRPLWHFQKKALAWLEANKDSGVCALEAGMGKTTVAIATIRNLQQRAKSGEKVSGNGRFLFVCEKKLVGNFAKEVSSVLRDDPGQYDAAEVTEKTDVVTYAMFLKNRKTNPTYGDDYTAIFFDEAHLHLLRRTSAKYKAAVGVKCPRKIILSASPMVSTPRDMLVLASVTNSVDLNTREGRLEEKSFVKRFAKKVGNRIVGVTDDPDLEEYLRTWVKRNIYYGDKRDTASQTGLPPISVVPPIAVSMPQEVETVYRQTMTELLAALQTVASKDVRKDRAVAIEASRVKLAQLIGRLTKLSDVPNRVIPGLDVNPKIEQASQILRERISGRTLLFTDSVALATDAFMHFQTEYPGRTHAVALNGSITVVNPAGKVIEYRQKAYTDPATGKEYSPSEWTTYILGMLQKIESLMTLTCTGGYAVGQNLQSFSAVVHLDRDSWSAESMKQRTARAWRSGQRQEVTEFTLDMVYGNPIADAEDDRTLDQIRRYLQEMDSALFDRVIKDSKEYVLGETWTGLQKQRAMTYQLDRKMVERALSPYANQLGR